MSPLVRALAERHRLLHIDEGNVDAFLDGDGNAPRHAILFFPGDPLQRAETDDVAVIFPELVAAFRGRVRAAVVAETAVEALKPKFHVSAVPSLVVLRERETTGVIPRIRDWSEYIAMIEAFLKPSAKALKPVSTSPCASALAQGAVA